MDQVNYTVYTFGFDGNSIKDLESAVRRLGATIIDIRMEPYGPSKVFNRPQLQNQFGARYVWIKELSWDGICQDCGKVEVKDIDLGTRKLGSITADGTPVILLCACENIDECHRNDLAKQLNEECGWKICHLPQPVAKSGDLFLDN